MVGVSLGLELEIGLGLLLGFGLGLGFGIHSPLHVYMCCTKVI